MHPTPRHNQEYVKPPLTVPTVAAYASWRRSQRIGILVVCCMIFAILAIYIRSTSAADHPLCTYFDELSREPGVQVAEWIGYPQGWRNYPNKWDYETLLSLGRESAILSRTSGNETWLFGFRTLTEDNGHHDFCAAVLIVSNAP